jgi:hypothetical protein
VLKILIDHESEELIPMHVRASKLKYSVINSSYSLLAKIAHNAIDHK